MNESQDAILNLDSEGHLIYWNAAAQALFRLDPVSALGADFVALLAPPSAVEQLRAALRPLLASQEPRLSEALETELCDRQGAPFSARLQIDRRTSGARSLTLVLVQRQEAGTPETRAPGAPATVTAPGSPVPEQAAAPPATPVPAAPELAVEAVLQQAPDGILVCDREGIVTYMNDAARRLLGPATGKPYTSLLADLRDAKGGSLDPATSAIGRACAGEATSWQEVVAMRTSGPLALLIGGAALRDGAGDAQGCVATVVAANTGRLAELSAASASPLFEALFKYTAEALVVCDAQGRVRRANPAARRLALEDPVGADPRAVARVWGEIRSGEGAPLPEDEWPLIRATTGEAVVGRELQLLHPDGKAFHLLVSAYPIRVHARKVVGAMATFADITRLKRTEAELRSDLERARETEAELRQTSDRNALWQRETRQRLRSHIEVLSALLNAESNSTRRPDLERLLLELQHYLAALLQFEEQFSSEEEPARLPMGEYLETLVRTLWDVHDRPAVSIRIGATEVAVEAKRASEIGLIVTSLVGHVFTAQAGGKDAAEIGVSLDQADDTYVLRVWDTQGRLKARRGESTASLPWSAVRVLAERLSGEMTIDAAAGAIQVAFPVTPPAARRDAQRQQRRIRVRHPAVCRLLGPDPTVVRGELRNVSVDGAQLGVPTRLPLGAEVEIDATVDGEPFQARAEVIYSDLLSQRDPSTRYVRHGLKWATLDAAAQRVLGGIVSSHPSPAASTPARPASKR